MANKSNVPATVPALGGDASLNRYLSEIRKFPLLKPEQEYMLAKRYAEIRTLTPQRSLSPRICASWPRSPWAIAVTACRSAS